MEQNHVNNTLAEDELQEIQIPYSPNLYDPPDIRGGPDDEGIENVTRELVLIEADAIKDAMFEGEESMVEEMLAACTR